MSEFMIPEEKKEEITRDITTRIIKTPGMSRDEVENIVASEFEKLRPILNKARDSLILLLAQCRVLARWKAGIGRQWQKELRDNINAAEKVLGFPLTSWNKKKENLVDV